MKEINRRLGDMTEYERATKGQMNSRFDIIENKLTSVGTDVSEVKSSVERMVQNRLDVMELLKQINAKL